MLHASLFLIAVWFPMSFALEKAFKTQAGSVEDILWTNSHTVDHLSNQDDTWRNKESYAY